MPVAMKFLVICSAVPHPRRLCEWPALDTSHPSVNFDQRMQFIVLHYTATNASKLVGAMLTKGQVSSHYLIGDDARATIYKLVDEDSAPGTPERASGWAAPGSTPAPLASRSSIRVIATRQQVGSGIRTPKADPVPGDPCSRTSATRNRINPRFIIGHSDIAPGASSIRVRCSPGSAWLMKVSGSGPRPRRLRAYQAEYAGQLPSITWFQQELARLGYETPQTGELDVATRRVLAAFQMRFRPALFDGTPDAQSAAILRALNHR
jgi:N-acetylmuramoyl-L-alanine amidase